MKLCTVNLNLLPVKLHYFLFFGALAGVLPFIPVYAKQMDISALAVGAIYAVLACLTMFTKPIFGCIADIFQKLNLVLIALLLTEIAATLALSFIPLPRKEIANVTTSSNNESVEIFCFRKSSYLITYDLKHCEMELENTTNKCLVSCALCEIESVLCNQNVSVENVSLFKSDLNSTESLITKCLNSTTCQETCHEGTGKCKSSEIASNPPLQLWSLTILLAIIWLTSGAAISLSNTACYNTLENQPELFGHQRVWGTIGCGIFATLTGYLNQMATGNSKTYDYSAGFYLLAALYITDLLVVKRLTITEVKTPKTICKDVEVLIIQPKMVAFICGIFFIGMLNGMYESYLFWYLRTLGANQLILGLCIGIRCFFGEVPYFFVASFLIRKIGYNNALTLSIVAYSLRFVIYSYLINPVWSLPVELLRGPCYSIFYVAMVSYGKVIAPEGTEATMQGIVSGTYEGIGAAVGNLLGGYGFQTYGGRSTFFWVGIAAALFGCLNYAVHMALGHKPTGSRRR